MERDDTRIGAGHAQAMFRLGLQELREVFTFSESNIAQPSEQGIYGTATPQEVMDSKRMEDPEPKEEQSSVIADRLRQLDARENCGRDLKSKQLEME